MYRSREGGPPVVHCHHKESCGFRESLFTLLATRVGGRQAADAIKRMALLRVPRAHWPTARRLALPETLPDKPIREDA
jgi:hypothetical protein